jgi:hypothetical protein
MRYAGKKQLSSNRKLYNSAVPLRNVGSDRRFHRVLPKAFPGQVLSRFDRASEPPDERPCPLDLRLQPGERL